jgi:hypothetical protein
MIVGEMVVGSYDRRSPLEGSVKWEHGKWSGSSPQALQSLFLIGFNNVQ